MSRPDYLNASEILRGSPATSAPADLHSFRLAHPVVRSSSRFDVTVVTLLSLAAVAVWALVLPLELLIYLRL